MRPFSEKLAAVKGSLTARETASWADRCRAMRARLGLSQAQFARRLSGGKKQSLSVRIVQEWEGGRRKPPGWVQRLIQREVHNTKDKPNAKGDSQSPAKNL